MHSVEIAVLDKFGNGELFLRDLALKKSDWFTVGIADLTLSGNKTNGPAELLNPDKPQYSDDTNLQGRLAFYSTGKFSNGWSLTASADTREGPLDEIFSNFMDKSPDALFRRKEDSDALHIVLKSEVQGSVKVDDPILYREVDVGKVTGVELSGDASFVIDIAGRGFDAHVSTEHDVALPDSACVYCGNCIQVCPTGALSIRRPEMEVVFDHDKSSVCELCVPACPVRAMQTRPVTQTFF